MTLQDLVDLVKGLGFTVTSTTGGTHNTGSAHYQGRAIDVRTKDKLPSQVDRLISYLRSLGLTVRDERTRPAGQAVWSGAHIHVELPKSLLGGSVPPGSGDYTQNASVSADGKFSSVFGEPFQGKIIPISKETKKGIILAVACLIIIFAVVNIWL